jgi:TonB-linked SusC/RagA family outer membrane protein
MNFYTKVWDAFAMHLLSNPLYKKRLIMRINLTFLIVFALCSQISASSFSQITIKGSNISVKELIRKIERQSSYVFLMSEDVGLLKNKVSVNLTNASVEDALSASLKGTGLTFSIIEKNILLKKEKLSLAGKIASLFSSRKDITFKVLGDDGQTLTGATLKIVNSALVQVSDSKGQFHLKDVEDHMVVEISFVSYETASFLVSNIKGAVTLKKADVKLEEVVINKGYYSTSQKLNTGSTVQVTSKDLERQPLTNPITSLQGLVPGMYIKQSSGVAGSINTVQIRGRSSISSGTAPLYIVDGVPFLSTAVDRQIGAGATILGPQANGATDPMSVINAADIESITILKDADATAIYGSRGSNGVVLITTKKAKPGISSFKFNLQKGYGQVVNQLDLLPVSEYLALRRRAFANDNITPQITNTALPGYAPDLLMFDQNRSTDIQDLLIGNTSKITDFTTSLSVGTAKSSVLISGGYHDESSVLFGGAGYKRGTVNMSASTSSADDRLKLGIAANLSFGQNNMPGSDFTSGLYTIPQNFSLYDANGGINWARNINNPIAVSRQKFKVGNKNININTNLSYQIIDDLTFRTNIGYNRIDQRQSFQAGASTISPLATTPVSAASYSSAVTEAIITEAQFDYTKKINDHTATLSTGGTWQDTKFEIPYIINAVTFSSELLMESFTNAGTISPVRALNSEYKSISFFGRANYNYKEKYVINALLRRDGSSRFGPDKRFGYFGSIGAAWIFSDEDFFKDLSFLSFGKLRGSFGVTGNDQVTNNYGYSDTFTITPSAYGGVPGFYPTRIANPSFRWESSRKFELAMELRFLNDRISFIPAFYRNRSDNMIISTVPLPGQTGFINYIGNLNFLVQNQGFEMDINFKAIKTKELQWDLGFNITQIRNKVLNIPEQVAASYANTYQVGQSLSMFQAYHFTGFVDGVAQVEDRNGDGVITPGLTGDYYAHSQRDPSYYGGLTSALTYKRFRLDALLSFAKQNAFAPIAYPGAFGAQLGLLRNSQFIPSTVTSTPSYVSYATRYTSSDAMISDASFIRVRNISLAYNLPEKWIRAVKVNQLELFARGQNLFTFTKYKGLDPETQTGVLPPLKIFTAGLSCSF